MEEKIFPYQSKSLALGLLFLLGLRIKTVLRLILTGITFGLLLQLKNKFPNYRLQHQNITPLILYCCYLFLGLISVFWTSSVRYSILQLSMITEALVFAWFYIQLVAFYNAISDNHTRFSWLFGHATMWICLAFLLGLALDPDTFYRQTHGGARCGHGLYRDECYQI